MGSTASPATLRCGTSWILSIPRTCGPRSARSSVACNAARCSNASSIWTAITCCRWTAPPISPPPRSIVPLSGKAPSQRQRHLFPSTAGATLVHPDLKEVIPLAPEPIIQQDGQAKNDCERNATRRWLKRFRQEHPHLPVIVVEDALSANAPHLRDLREAGAHYIIGVKPGDHAFLFDHLRTLHEAGQMQVLTLEDPATGVVHHL